LQKVAFITGTGKGIGKAIAEILLDENYLVFGFSRTNIIEHKNFTFTQIDLADLKQVQNITFPKLNPKNLLLVNNAATIGEIVPIDLKSDVAIIEEYNLNIITPTLLCKKFIQCYKKEKKLIINISSGASNKSIASWSTYCATKSALDRLTGVIDEENHKALTVFSVYPGVVDTNMQAEIRDSNPNLFPFLDQFTSYYNNNELENATIVAQKLNYIIKNRVKFSENIVSIRNVDIK
jgi:benzil reductase ((S)-benzoin forming)